MRTIALRSGLGSLIAMSVLAAASFSAQDPTTKQTERDRLLSQQKYAEALVIAKEIVSATKPGTLERAVAFRAQADAEYGLGRYKDAESTYKSSVSEFGASGGGDTLEAALAHNGLGRALYQQRELDRAETSLKRALTIRESLAPKSLDTATTCSDIGNVYYLRGQLPEAEAYYRRALEIRQEASPGSLFVAVSETTLGNVALGRGDLDAAQKHYERALALFQDKAPGSIGESQVLNNLAGVARERGDLSLAETSYEGALVIQQRLAPGSVDEARTLSNLGAVHWSRGNLSQAQERLEAALEIQERLAAGSLEHASTLNNLGAISKERGDLDAAQRRFEQALAIQKGLAPDSLSVAASLNNIGGVAKDRGDLTLADEKFREAMAIRMRLAPNSLDVANSHVSIGVVALNRGDLVQAQNRFEQALTIQRRLAPESLSEAQTLNFLGSVAHMRGDLPLAQTYFDSAIKIQRRLAKNSVSTAQNLDDLGAVAWSKGDYDRAQALFEEAMAIYKSNSPDSLSVASSFTNLGVIAHERNDLDTAQRMFEQALVIQQRIAPGSMVVATTLSNLGAVAFDRQLYADAKGFYERSLVIRKDLAPGSLEEATGINDLDAAVRYSGDLEASSMLLQQRLFKLRDYLARESVAGVQSRSWEAIVAGAIKEIGIHAPNGLAPTYYKALTNIRGLTLSTESRQRSAMLATKSDPAVRAAQSVFSVAMKAETAWVLARTPEISNKEFESRLAVLRGEVDKARRNLASTLVASDPRTIKSDLVGVEDVQNGLGIDTTLIEYVRVSGWDPKQKKDSDDEYGAFVVTKNEAPRWVSLGKASAIDEGVQDFQDAMSFSSGAPGDVIEERRLSQTCSSLYQLLIAPLGSLNEGLMIVPDAALFQLPFAALIDGGGKYLIESHFISNAGSGRDLAEVQTETAEGRPAVFGGPQFDLDPMKLRALRGDDSPLSQGTTVVRGTAVVGKWEPLAGAMAESEGVAPLLGADLFVGEDASEESLMALKRPTVLHIATHGFFYPPAFDERASQAVLEGNGIGRGLKVADSPMLRSGLILAGANDEEDLRREGAMDGWGTALELSQMDLRGTELVVLSGCETGRGDYRLGQGVFGLQRAFKYAGAKTLVMSLFKVPDTSTRSLFEKFYSAWRPGMQEGTKLKAMRDAQLALLRDPSTKNPKNWAGFVLLGGR